MPPDATSTSDIGSQCPYAALTLCGTLAILVLQIARGTHDLLRDDRMDRLQQENRRLIEEKHSREFIERGRK